MTVKCRVWVPSVGQLVHEFSIARQVLSCPHLIQRIDATMRISSPQIPTPQLPQERPTNPRNSLAGRWYATVNRTSDGEKRPATSEIDSKDSDQNKVRGGNVNTLGDFLIHNHKVVNTVVRFDEITRNANRDVTTTPSLSSGEDMLRAETRFSEESDDTFRSYPEDEKRVDSELSTNNRRFPSSARIRLPAGSEPPKVSRVLSAEQGTWSSHDSYEQRSDRGSIGRLTDGDVRERVSNRQTADSSERRRPKSDERRDSSTKVSRVLHPERSSHENSSQESPEYRSSAHQHKSSGPHERDKPATSLSRSSPDSHEMPLQNREYIAHDYQRQKQENRSSRGSLDHDQQKRAIYERKSGESTNRVRRSHDNASKYEMHPSSDRRHSSSGLRQDQGTGEKMCKTEDAVDSERQRFDGREWEETREDTQIPASSQPFETRIEYIDEISPRRSAFQAIPPRDLRMMQTRALADESLASTFSPQNESLGVISDTTMSEMHAHGTLQIPTSSLEQQLAHPPLAPCFSERGQKILSTFFPRACTPIGTLNDAVDDGQEETNPEKSIWSYLDPHDDLNYYDYEANSSDQSSQGVRRQKQSDSRRVRNPKSDSQSGEAKRAEDKYSEFKSDHSQRTNLRSGNPHHSGKGVSSSHEGNDDALIDLPPGRKQSQPSVEMLREVYRILVLDKMDFGEVKRKSTGTKKSRDEDSEDSYQAEYSTPHRVEDRFGDKEIEDVIRGTESPNSLDLPTQKRLNNFTRHSTGGVAARSLHQKTSSSKTTDDIMDSRDAFLKGKQPSQPSPARPRSRSAGRGARIVDFLGKMDQYKDGHQEKLPQINQISRNISRSRSNDGRRTTMLAQQAIESVRNEAHNDFFDDPFSKAVDHSSGNTAGNKSPNFFPFGPDFFIPDELQCHPARNPAAVPDSMFGDDIDDGFGHIRSIDNKDFNGKFALKQRDHGDMRLQKKLENVRERSLRNVEKLKRLGEGLGRDSREQRPYKTPEHLPSQSANPRNGASSSGWQSGHTTESEHSSGHLQARGKRMVGKRLDRLFEDNRDDAATSTQTKALQTVPRTSTRSKGAVFAQKSAVVLEQDPWSNGNEELQGHYMYVAYSRFGRDARKVIQLCEHQSLPVPTSRTGDVLIRVQASTVSWSDCAIRRGEWLDVPLDPYIIPGVAFVGRALDATRASSLHLYNNSTHGQNKKKWNQPSFSFSSPIRPGDMVLSLVPSGANARYICLPRDQLVKVPPLLDPDKAVCLVETYLTAFQALHRGQKGALRYRESSLRGKTVLVMSGYTSLGKALIELCQAGGAEFCYALADHPDQHQSRRRDCKTARPGRRDGSSSGKHAAAASSSSSSSASKRHFDALARWGAIPLSKNPADWLTLIGRQVDLLVTVYDPSDHGLYSDHVSGDHWKALKKDGQVVVVCTHPGLDQPAQREGAFGRRGALLLPSGHHHGDGTAVGGGAFRLAACRPSHREKLADRTAWYNLFDSWGGGDHRRGQGGRATAKKDLEHLLRLLEMDRVHPDVMERIPLSKVAKAQSLLEQKRLAGHLVCAPWLKQQTETRRLSAAAAAGRASAGERE